MREKDENKTRITPTLIVAVAVVDVAEVLNYLFEARYWL
jgi:hypothetical protein